MNTATDQSNRSAVNFRFTGHETFPCRYTWLPKAVRNLGKDPALFSDEDGAMVSLGVGKNMVRAVKFWADSASVTSAGKTRGQGLEVSPFGRKIFGKGGHDEFLEDIKTLWLIQWKFSVG